MKPKAVYHGTSAFDANDIITHGVLMEKSEKGYFGRGFYTTENKALAKSNYADFAEDEDGPGVVLAFNVSSRARLLDLRKGKDWDRYISLRWRGVSLPNLLHRDDFHTIMQDLGIDGLYDESFEGWVFYNPKVLKLTKSNPLLPLPADFFPKVSKQRDQLKLIREDIYQKTGIWYDDLDEVAAVLNKAQVAHRRKQIRLVSKANPPGRFPVMSYAAARKWEPMAARQGVSKVARSSRGFMRAYQRAGRWRNLPDHWKRKRNAFVARHMAQVRQNRENLWKNGKPSRRALALIMWAYMPPLINRVRGNPEPHPLDPVYHGVFKRPEDVPPKANDGDAAVVWREEYGRWECWVYDSVGRMWAYAGQGNKTDMVRLAKKIIA